MTSTLVSSGVDGNGSSYDVVNASISGLNLGAGSYWIGFVVVAPHFSVASGAGGNFGGIITSPPHSGFAESFLLGNIEYQLLSGVPEPATWVMMLAGFAGLATTGWRARRKAAGGE